MNDETMLDLLDNPWVSVADKNQARQMNHIATKGWANVGQGPTDVVTEALDIIQRLAAALKKAEAEKNTGVDRAFEALNQFKDQVRDAAYGVQQGHAGHISPEELNEWLLNLDLEPFYTAANVSGFVEVEVVPAEYGDDRVKIQFSTFVDGLSSLDETTVAHEMDERCMGEDIVREAFPTLPHSAVPEVLKVREIQIDDIDPSN